MTGTTKPKAKKGRPIKDVGCTTVVGDMMPELFWFPLDSLKECCALLPRRTRLNIRFDPIRVPKRVPEDGGPARIYDHHSLPAKDPECFRDTEEPTTLFLTACYKEPQLIADVMAARTATDLLGFLHKAPYAIPDREEGDDEEGIYSDHPLLTAPGRHIWRPGEIYATPYAAPTLYRLCKARAIKPASTMRLKAISPNAAVKVQGLKAKELHFLMRGVYRKEWGMEYPRSESSLRSAMSRAGGLGGAPDEIDHAALGMQLAKGGMVPLQGTIASQFPPLPLNPIITRDLDVAMHRQLSIEYVKGDEEMPLHFGHIATLSTDKLIALKGQYNIKRNRMLKHAETTFDAAASNRYRAAKYDELIEEAKEELLYAQQSRDKLAIHKASVFLDQLKEAKLYSSEAVMDRAQRKRLDDLELKWVSDFNNLSVQSRQYLVGIAGSRRLYELACEEFVKDEYTLDCAYPNESLASGLQGMSRERQMSIGKEIWLAYLFYGTFLSNKVDVLSAQELLALSMILGIPVQLFVQYFMDLEARTGFWLLPVTVFDDLIALIGNKDDLGDSMFFQAPEVIEELQSLEEHRLTMASVSLELSERIYRASKVTKKRPLTFVQVN